MNEKDFESAYHEHAKGLLRFCLRFAHSRDQAEELVHDVFVELLNGRFRERSGDGLDLKGWLYTVARNKCLNRVSRTREFATGGDEGLEVASPSPNAEEILVSQARSVALARVREGLPADLEATLALRESGLSYEEIAARLEIPIGTVKSRFHRLVHHMKQELDV